MFSLVLQLESPKTWAYFRIRILESGQESLAPLNSLLSSLRSGYDRRQRDRVLTRRYQAAPARPPASPAG